MTASTAYLPFVRALQKTLREAAMVPLPGDASRPPEVPPGQADALLFSPHPDDEALMGALALRLAREAGIRVVNVAVTLGSRPGERAGRLEEVQASCARLGFGLLLPCPEGFNSVHPVTRTASAALWSGMVQQIREILRERQPKCIFLPHAGDWHSTHVGTHWLVMDALRAMALAGEAFSGLIIETEYWCTNPEPNLLVESSPEDVALLVAAAACHVSQVARNPYHLRLPAFMLDNVRRGGELVLGQYAAAPAMDFATLYRVSRWKGDTLHPVRTRQVLQAAHRLSRWVAVTLSG